MNEEGVLGFKAAVAGILGLLTALWGWFGWLLVIWVFLMAVDWLAGSILACRRGQWFSAKLREGAWHKGGMVLTVLVALVADWLIRLTIDHLPLVKLPFDYTVLLAPLVVMWYIVGELGSLAEHAAATGAPVPGWLLHILAAGRKAVDAAGEKVSGSRDDQKGDDAP